MASTGMESLSLPPHCTPTTPFLRDLSAFFHICVPTSLALVSTALGTLSIVSWLFAQLPQIYKNYHLKSTAGLSIFFLVEWMAGDATNLAGGLLTKQATWQVVLASYYVFVDVCLVVQFFWYSYLAPQVVYGHSLRSGSGSGSSTSSFQGNDDNDDGGGDGGDSINGLSPINTSFIEHLDASLANKDGADDEISRAALALPPPTIPTHRHPQFGPVNYEKSRSDLRSPSSEKAAGGLSWISSASPGTLMLGAAALASLASPSQAAPVGAFLNTAVFNSDGPHNNNILLTQGADEIVGTFVSWCSAILYLGSRLPQLYKNWQRQSTTGLSPLLFLAAFCGNLFYSSSLLFNPNAWNDFGPYGGHGWVDEDGSVRAVWLARSAPFFIGAAGVLVMDGLMGLQFLMYNGGVQEQVVVVKIRDGHGRSHWERVNGWMRGWIPTMTTADKAKVVDLAESQRLLGLSHSKPRSGSTDYGTGTL